MRRDAVMPPIGLATPSALDASPLLPRLSAAAARALTRAYTAQAPLAVTIGATAYQVTWRADAAPAADARAYRFAVGPAHGTLWIDALAEHEWLGDAAHEAVPPVLRCALLADLCAGMIGALQTLTRQHIELLPPPVSAHFIAPSATVAAAAHEAEPFPTRGWRPAPAALCFELSRAPSDWRCHGALTFDAQDALGVFFSGAPALAVGADTAFARLPVPLTFEIGRTELTAAELADVVCGDIIAIERWRSKGQSLLCPARVCGVPGWEIEGRTTGNRIVVERIKEMPLEQSQSPDPTRATPVPATGASEDAPQQTGARQLDTLAIDLSFELPSCSMSLAELGALQPGAVIELEQSINQSVIHIVANSMLIGTGTLIAVGQKLGVRVTALNPPAPHNTRER